MANFIDIKEFDGVLTNADIEDLPDNVAQEIKNLKIQAGKLEKTFGAGTASGIPSIGLTFVNASYSPSKAYTVHNIFTFVSDKFEGDINDAGDGYRYLLVTVEATDQSVKLWWWDSSLPDVTDHLQIEDDIVWFQTATAHGITEDDQVLVQDIKDNASPQASITSGSPATPIGVYESADVIPSTTKVGINTDTAQTWGGSFFSNTLATGASAQSFSGKHNTHLLMHDSISHNSTLQGKIYDVAIASMNGRALSIAKVSQEGKNLITCVGSSVADLSTQFHDTYRDESVYFTGSMIGFNNAIYVHHSYTESGSNNNFIVKYTCSSNGTVSESVVGSNLSSTLATGDSWMKVVNGNLYLLIKGIALYQITPSDSVSTISTSGITASQFVGLASISSTNFFKTNGSLGSSDVNHEYLFIAQNTGVRFILYYNDALSFGSWVEYGTPIVGTFKAIESANFRQNNGKSHSLVIHYLNSSGHTKLQYSTHSDSSVLTGFNDINTSIFANGTDIEFISSTYNSPGSTYLIVGTDDVFDGVSSPTVQVNGKLYSVSTGLSVVTINNQAVVVDGSAKSKWNPTCFADCVTETHGGEVFFEHAKGYIGIYGSEALNVAGANSADLYRMTDIGWLANTWNGSGDCEYRWIDINNKYGIKEIDTNNIATTPLIYHKKDKNPIIVSGDNIRFLPGSVGKISNVEAKGVWLGHIERSLFNETVSIPADFYVYVNKLNNPFSITNTRQYNTGESLRPGNSVKYNITAVYDGVQETLFDKSKEKIFSETGISNNVIELELEFNASDLNKRITGINIYRALEFSNTASFDGYSNYQLIGHMTFVDSQTAIPTTTSNVIGRLHVWRKDQVFIKSTENLNGYDGESYGINKFALGVNGGWDGIDTATEWAGPPSNGTSDEFQWTVYHSPLVRKMNATQGYMIVSALEKDNTLANTFKCEIEIESVVINDTASAYDYTGFTATVASGSGILQFTMSSVVEGYFAVGDKIMTVASPGIAGSTYWNVHSVGTGSSQIVTASRQDGNSTTGASGVSIYMHIPASGVLVGIDRHGLGSPSATVNSLDNTSASIPAIHDVNTGINIRSQSLPRSYSQFNLDSDASMGDSYLDSGVMIGSDWKIEKRNGGQYSTSLESTSGGAYGGPKIGFLFFPYPIDITGTLGTDTTGNLLTEGYFSGSLLLLQGDESFLIEANSAYEPTLGGCWVRLNKKHNTFGIDNDILDEEEAGHIKDNVRIISGFKQTNAQGATTPGMAFNIVSGTNVRVVCQDFRLEDLGEPAMQSVYSNRVNAQHAVKLKGRLFLGNLYLNPDDKAEERGDWIAYSELNQYDNRPVSNVVTLDDREGGSVTGLATLFGRLIIFKPQSIFVLNINNPSDPNSWSVTESKHSIGNIAPEGVVEVHDSVYFVFNDGIYVMTSNMVADSTATPSIMEKITLTIEDQFLLANSVKDIKGIYDQKNTEILYTWQTGSPATQVVWAYHIILKTWRKVETTTNLDILTFGENSGPVAWDNTDTDIKKFDVPEAVGTVWKSKRFRLDLDQKKLLRYGMVKFTGTDTLTVNIYLDGAGSVSFTKDITADGGVNRFPIKRYGKNFEIELTTPSSTNVFSVERMRIETE